MRYSIDTSAILDGWTRYYPPDIFPALWGHLDELIKTGGLIATEEVLVELERKEDSTYEWFRQRKHMFIPIDGRIQEAVTKILQDYERLVDTSKNRSMCDPFVIAVAQVERCSVVTAEKMTNNPAKPRIPDVCQALGIETITLLELIRRQHWVFRN